MHTFAVLIATILFLQIPVKNSLAGHLDISETIKIENPVPDSLVFQLDEVVVSAFNRSQALVEIPGSLTYLGSLLMEREKHTYNF
ncbi:MAG: hypothetical protein K0B37_05620, partial [Bacteroidales bacterium]|nr:hypothetical protein [Bacteroidales bacterium]